MALDHPTLPVLAAGEADVGFSAIRSRQSPYTQERFEQMPG